MRVVIGTAILLAACDSGSASSVNPPATPSPTNSVRALVVFATWVPDSKVTTGPEPGYKPALSGLTGHDVQAATAVLDANGAVWMLNIKFTPAGSKLFAKLTHDNVNACAGDPAAGPNANCAQRHLAIWLDLTQHDIDSWESVAYVAAVSQPFDLACLTQAPSATPCPKFVSDPITLAEIDGGDAAISCGCTQKAASDLAAEINSARSS
jgi:preprotein translocase subunit SecD